MQLSTESLFESVISATTEGAGFIANGITFTSTDVGDTNTAFGSGGITDPDVTSLIQGAFFNGGTYTFSGLNVGDEYLIQILTNDSRTTGGRASNSQLWQTQFPMVLTLRLLERQV